jgi:hypothetical protein
VKNSLIVVVSLLIIVSFAGFVLQYIKVKRLENDLSVARQEIALAQLTDLAGLAFVQASQKNYGLAAETSKQFFIRTRAAELAQGNPEALGDLQVLFQKTHQAAGSIDR